MKIIRKLLDWKVWVFTIFPLILLAAWLGVLIYVYEKSIYEAPLIIGAQILFIFAIILIIVPSIILRLKQKKYIRGLSAVVFMLCFLGLQIALMTMTPSLIDIAQEERNLYQIYYESSYDDADHSEKREAWRIVRDKEYNLSFAMSMMNNASMIGIALSGICSQSHKRNKDEVENQSTDNKSNDL
ncbi:MAG: hypothetical protein K2K80_03055 [Clostridia bacterium]|nr:hypothetical protein [Clostridia bacterium]